MTHEKFTQIKSLSVGPRITVLKNVYPPVLRENSRDFSLLSWKSPGLQVTQVGRSEVINKLSTMISYRP